MHRAPIDLAQAGDGGLAGLPGHVKAQAVTELEAQGVGQALFHADGTLLTGHPAARHHLVIARLLRTVGQVELAVNQAPGALIRKIIGGHGFAVDGDQAAANHGIPVELFHASGPQRLLKGVALLRLHIDHEAIGRVRRCGLAPTADQIGAQEHQQHQRQQADRQRADLYHGICRARRQLPRGQHQPARGRYFAHTGAQQSDGQKTGNGKHQHGSHKSAHRDQAQLQVAAGGQQQGGKTRHSHAQHGQRGGSETADVAANHAQRRHLRQLQHRRQAKCQQQRQAHAHAKSHGPERGCGQRGFNQPAEQQHKAVMHCKAQAHAQRAGEKPRQHELKAVSQRNGALRLAQHAQHGAVIQMPGRKAARHNRHRHGAEQGGQQRDQVKKLFRALQRLAHGGVAAFQRLQPGTANVWWRARLFYFCRGPRHEFLHRLVVTRHGKAVTGAAGRLNQAGSGHVGLVDHHARRKTDEPRATIGLLHDDAGELETGIAQQQGLARAEAQRIKQRRIGPGRAGCGNLAGILTSPLSGRQGNGDLHAPAQRITFGNALEGHQLAGATILVTGAAHGREGHGGNGLQPQRLRPGNKGCRRLAVAAHHSIATQQLLRVALQATVQPVRKKTHGSQGRYCQRDRHDQQPQFTCPQIAQQGSPAKFQKKRIHCLTLAQKR